jgi:cytochrome c-type biogenesis protein CcmF
MRAGAVGGGAGFAMVSRESALLANNILLVVALSAVFLGTMYPLFLDALNLPKASVGPPYFNLVFPILMAPAVFLMGIGPIASWRQAELPDLAARLKWAFVVAAATAVLLPFTLGKWSPLVAVGLFLALWILVTTIAAVAQRVRKAPQQGLWAKLSANPAAWYGMLLAHLGVATFIVGVTLVKGYEFEVNVPLEVGQSVTVSGDEFTFRGVAPVTGPNYRGVAGTIEVRRDGKLVETMHPEKRVYNASGSVMTEAAINTRFLGDRYVSLGEPTTDKGEAGAWGVRVYIKPFVDWIWGGAFLMALGGFIAMSDRRYRLSVKQKFTAPSGAARAA